MAINKESVLEGTFARNQAEQQIINMVPGALRCWTAVGPHRTDMIFKVGPNHQWYHDTKAEVERAIEYTIAHTKEQFRANSDHKPRHLKEGEQYHRFGDQSRAPRTHGKDDGRHGAPDLTGYNRPLYQGK